MVGNYDFAHVFDPVAEHFDSIIDVYAFERRRQAVLPYLKGKILNVGSGTGILTNSEESDAYSVYMDISFNMCKGIKNRKVHSVLCGDAEILPFPDNAFDTVVSLEMVYYLKSPEHFFREAYRILKPGGILAVTSANHNVARCYDVFRWLLRKSRIKRSYFDDPVKRFMTEGDLKKFFRSPGFEIIATRRILAIPFKHMRCVDEFIEKTPLNRFSLFLCMAGTKTLLLDSSPPQSL